VNTTYLRSAGSLLHLPDVQNKPSIQAEFGNRSIPQSFQWFGPVSNAAGDPRGPSQVAIVVVSDSQFTNSHALQLQTLRCYAVLHGYKFALLHPKLVAPLCAKHRPEFFFRKHCIVRHFLARQPAKSAVVVLDADVVGGVSNLSVLSGWKHIDLTSLSTIVFVEI
jgi:hypothetical protein